MPRSIAIIVDTSTTSPRRERAIIATVRSVASAWRRFAHVSTVFQTRVWSARDPDDTGLTPNEVLDDAALRDAYRLAFTAASELVDQARQLGEFGTLMSSNWDMFVSTLRDDFEFQALALGAVQRLRPTRTVVISSSTRRAVRCARWLRQHGHRASVIPVPSASLGRKAPLQATAIEYQYEGGQCDVLFVPESTAMAGSLEDVAACVSQELGMEVGRARAVPRPSEDSRARTRRNASVVRSGMEALSRLDFPVSISEATLGAEWATWEQARALLRRAAPKLLVIGNDRFVTGQLLVATAHELGARVLCIQDGLAADVPQWWLRRADFTAANGTFLRDILVREGADPSSVTVTGQPRYDRLLRNAKAVRREAARANLGVSGDLPVVLFALQDTHDPRYISAIVNALMSIAEIRVVVRPHPWHPRDVVRDLESTYAARLRVARDNPLLDCLVAADVVVSQYSTVLVEAAMLGIPGVGVSLSGSRDPIDLSEHGIVAGARDLETFVTAVRRALEGQSDISAARFEAEQLIGPLDGQSAARVARLVVTLLERSR